MQPQSGDSENTVCSFCQQEHIERHILKETPTFRIVADHAPLVAGHILIVPRNHYTCYGDAPASLDAELLALKREVAAFQERYYAAPVFWEHGIFRQTVFHAHLHCFPFGSQIHYDPATQLHAAFITSQNDLRTWHAAHGHYFYLEDGNARGMVFRAEVERYQRIVQQVLWPGASARMPKPVWRSPQQRQLEGLPQIQETIALWQTFQQEGATGYADTPDITRSR